MAELKSRQRRRRAESPPAEPTIGKLNECVAQLHEHLEAVQQRNQIRDDELARQTRDLAELRTELTKATRDRDELRELLAHQRSEWQQEVEELHHVIDDSLAQQTSPVDAAETKKHNQYQQTIRRIRSVVREHLPRRDSVLVVSRGDGDLLKLHGRRAGHFPQSRNGEYAGNYPRTSFAAMVQLEALRMQGADYLLFPQTAFWWLDHYSEFAHFLDSRFRKIPGKDDCCVIFSLREPAVASQSAPFQEELEKVFAECEARFENEPALLDWNTGSHLSEVFPQRIVLTCSAVDGELPYLDQTIDIVALASSDPADLSEAHRIAKVAIVSFPEETGVEGAKVTVKWKPEIGIKQALTTSIIIPCHNAVTYTEACLKSLLETLPENFPVEIIVIDDASTDKTGERLRSLSAADKRVKVLRNAKNLGYLASCNRAARAASGDILLFLNNDTILLPGWLPPLLKIFEHRPDAGAVGGKLLFPDGTLQEAGGLVFRDGSADHFGRDDHDIDAPFYNYVREVDYCSGAFLATKRSVFLEIGGFDEQFKPGYYEDTDYGFALRERGLQVYYQPESVIVHYEGATAGTDLSAGPKRYQVLNQEKFARKWSKALERQPVRWTGRDPLYFVTRSTVAANAEVVR